jgi:hypothetical protein
MAEGNNILRRIVDQHADRLYIPDISGTVFHYTKDDDMTTKTDPPAELDLVSVADIADRLGVGVSAVTNWRARHESFPRPVGVIARGGTPVFLWPSVQRWCSAYSKPGKAPR